MNEEKPEQKKSSETACRRLDAAYMAMRADATESNYKALMEAFEADARDDAHAFLPVPAERIESMREGSRIQWQICTTPKGKMLAMYTSREQVEKHAAEANVGVKLSAFVRMALLDANISGILLNPLDGRHGIPVERHNLQVLVNRLAPAGAPVPQLNPQVVSAACMRLFEVAVGVPTAVYDIRREMEALGGHDAVLKPVVEKWNASITSGAFKPASPEEYVRTLVQDVMKVAFVRGSLARKDAEMAKTADPEGCVSAVPYLLEDLKQNTDEYLIILSDLIRSGTKDLADERIWTLLAGNIAVIALGALSFGMGWGIAKCCASEGPVALMELRDYQQAFLEHLKKRQAEAAAAAKEEKK